VTPIPPFLVFLIAVPLVHLLRGRPRQITMVLTAGLALILVSLLEEGSGWAVPFMEYELVLLRVDSLSLLMGRVFSIVTLLAILYAAAFSRPWLHVYALLYAGTSLGAVFAGDFVTLLLFWEGMATTSTLLIWERGGDAVAAGFRYVLFHGLSGGLLAGGVALQFLETGTLLVGPTASIWSSLLIVLAAGVNAGFIPLHTWIPDAYPRSHIASSVFLSVYTTKTAVYLFARAAPALEVVALMGGVMALYGAFRALLQTDMRRILSYSIISQVGYMLAGIGLGSALGVSGGMIHAFNDILFKALLFMTVGAVIHATGRDSLRGLGGLARKMPITFVTFWVAALSVSGVPGFSGYVSKGMVLAAAHEIPILRLMLEVASFGTLLYVLRLGYFLFLKEGDVEAHDPPVWMLAAQVGAAGLCVAIGIYPALLLGALPGSTYDPWTVEHLRDAAIVLVPAALLFAYVGRRVLAPREPEPREVDVLYLATGRWLLDASRHLERSFAILYDSFLAGVAAVGRGARRLQTGDLNWNSVGLAIGLLMVLLWLLLEVV
jgi:multicomponent Na+:H+ antiporter subunit D